MSTWTLIYAIAAAQGMLLGVALWQRRSSSPANRLLAGWMVLVAFDLGVRAWVMADPGAHHFKLMRLVALFPFLHASLFYLYVRSVIDGRGLCWADLRHGLGFMLALLAIADLLLLDAAGLEAAFAAYRTGAFRTRQLMMDVGLFVVSLSYVGAAVTLIVRHRRQLRATRSDSHPDALRWLILMAACQCLIWIIALGQWLLPLPWLSYRLIYAAVAGWVLLVGYFSLLRPDDEPASAGAVPESSPVSDASPEPPPLIAASEPLDTGADSSSVDDPRFDEVVARLTQLMEVHGLHREPALGIAGLARRSGYPEYLVSAVINRRFGLPFWDYVNRYRVMAARDRLLDPRESRTALDIAYDCGFTSKSTFNAAFKRLLGETPSACRARARPPGQATDSAADTARPAAD